MSACDFICRFLGLIPAQNCNKETVRLLANVVDTTKDGLDVFFGTALLVSMLRQYRLARGIMFFLILYCSFVHY